MALFFRGETRKFFLMLLGGCRSEKNCAGFGRELREFSRRWWAAVGGRSGWVGACVEMTGDERDAGRGRGRGWSRPVRQGFGRETAACSPMEYTAFGLVAGAGCPQRRGLPAELVIALTVQSHRVSSRVRCWMSTPRFVRRSGGCRCSPSKSTARRVDAGSRYPHRRVPASPLRWSPHRPDAQGRESIRLQDIHMSVWPWCKPLGSRTRRPVRVWISPPAETLNAVNFDSE